MWAVYLQDTNGSRRVVSLDLTEYEANLLIARIEDSHTKPHKVDYFKIEYQPETKYNTFDSLQIHY